MNCVEVKSKLDDYFDLLLPVLEKHTIAGHLDVCKSCSAEAERHLLYLKKMQSFSSATFTVGESARLLQNAESIVQASEESNNATTQFRQSSFIQGALAATAVISLLFLGRSWLDSSFDSSNTMDLINNSSSQVAEVIVWRDVKILINVPQDLHDARIILTLPAGIHVEGYEGLSEVAWQTDFIRGVNGLVMPVWLDSSVDLTVKHTFSATLEYEGQSKKFDLEIELTDIDKYGKNSELEDRINNNA